MRLHTTYTFLLLALLIGWTLPGIATAIDIPIRGSSAIVRVDTRTGNPRLTKLKSKAPKGSTIQIPAAGGSSDPTITGGTYRRCTFPSTGECETIDLPPSKWRSLGPKGWKYIGAGAGNDPCRTIDVRGKRIGIKCKGAKSLSDQFTLPVGVNSVVDELTLGDIRYCTKFDRPFRKDSFRRGHWRSKGSPAPAACVEIDGPIPTATPTPTPAPTPTPDPTPQPTATAPPPYGSASKAFVNQARSLLH